MNPLCSGRIYHTSDSVCALYITQLYGDIDGGDTAGLRASLLLLFQKENCSVSAGSAGSLIIERDGPFRILHTLGTFIGGEGYRIELSSYERHKRNDGGTSEAFEFSIRFAGA